MGVPELCLFWSGLICQTPSLVGFPLTFWTIYSILLSISHTVLADDHHLFCDLRRIINVSTPILCSRPRSRNSYGTARNCLTGIGDAVMPSAMSISHQYTPPVAGAAIAHLDRWHPCAPRHGASSIWPPRPYRFSNEAMFGYADAVPSSIAPSGHFRFQHYRLVSQLCLVTGYK